MFSGSELVYLLAAGAEALLRFGKLKTAMILVIPTLGYASWFVLFGHAARQYQISALHSRDALVRMPEVLAAGAIQSFGAVFDLHHHSLSPLLAPLCALGAFWALVAFERTSWPLVMAPRYYYVCAPFWLISVTFLLQPIWRKRLAFTLSCLIIVLSGTNVALLCVDANSYGSEGRHRTLVLAAVERARDVSSLIGDVELPSDVAPWMTVSEYFQATRELGSPVPAALVMTDAPFTREQLQALAQLRREAQRRYNGPTLP
jgi:hypothetical protein